MKYLFHLLLLFFLSFSIYAQPFATNLKPVDGTGNSTYALVVGVAKYLDPQIPQLQYANRDAEIFADFLKSKAGGSVPKENIRLLTDAAATTGAVYDAVYWLKKSCKKGDKVYIYFSGHGDLENITMYNNGFLICYDSPPFNFVKLALSIDYLNDIANTLSKQKEANVIIITDACHSGKLNEKKFKGNFLAADKLRKTKNTEIRITSSSTNQLSNENDAWGGGRGIFSYYLINGLKGAADTKNTGKVTLTDIKNYLDSALAKDEVLKNEGLIQTPNVNANGNWNFEMSTTDVAAKNEANLEIAKDKILQRAVFSASFVPADYIPESGEAYFFTLLKKDSLEYLTDSLDLNALPNEEITHALITKLKTNGISEAGQNKLAEFEKTLKSNKEIAERFNGQLAVAFDEVGQRIITKYLQGDAAELEKRRYYNINNNGYDVYPKMFEVALKLTQPDNYYYNILKVKLHYFTGVALRLKIPAVADPRALIEKAFTEQKKALALEEYAAYIYNELGILYTYKKNNAAAEKNFSIAADRAPSWAIPLVNLADLYAENGQLDKAILYADSAIKLQPDFQDIFVSYGIIYEKKAKLLQAQEAFQRSIKLNDRHFIPFERLGYVYINTHAFAKADSMFYEAAIRKKNFHISGLNNPRHMRMPKTAAIFEIQCSIDSNNVSSNDLMGHFTLGYQAYRDVNLATAENEFKKVIALDNKNPLAYHYLGKVLTEQQRWQEGEIMLKLAEENHLPADLYYKYYDSLSKNKLDAASFICIDSCFRFGYYDKEEDYLLLAKLYENWNHFGESEIYYRKLIAANPDQLNGYLSLANLFEKTGRFNDAENYLIEYNIRNSYSIDGELNKFYKRATDQFPENADWYLKAGNFEYAKAKSEPNSFSEDIKTIDPLTGAIVNKYPQTNLPGIGPAKEYRLLPYGSVIPKFKLKTKFTPFTEGIYYLTKALPLIQNDDMLEAAVNAKLGDLYYWQGLTDSAIYFYEAAIELNETDAGIRNKLVETYTSNYNYTKALIQLDTLNNKNELNFDKQLVLANFYMQEGNFVEAEKLLQAAAKINPVFNVELTALKGRLATLIKKPKLALENYKLIYELNKTDNINLYTIARVYAAAGNKPQAWKWLNLALEAGFNYTYVLKYDPSLQSFRKDNKWTKMLSDIEGKYPVIQ